MIDLYALTAAVFARPKTDAEGAAVRAALGAGADSVVLVEDIRIEQLGPSGIAAPVSHPARPFMALRRGPIPTLQRGIVNRPIYTWYVYDDIPVGYGRLEALLPLIAAAYALPLDLATVATDDIEVSAQGQTRDDRLGYLVCPIAVVIGAV